MFLAQRASRHKRHASPVAIFLALLLFLAAGSRSLSAEPLDRQVAEWVLLMGGTVRVEGAQDRIQDVTALPDDDFQLELVDLVGTNILPPDLARLIGLKKLRVLNLPGPMWNPLSGARINYSRDLRHIAGISTLEQLTVSYSFLDYIKFYDEGIEEIAPLTNLKVLSLESTKVQGHHLAPFTKLQALDVMYCPVDDEALRQLEGMTDMRRLLLRDTLVTDEGLRYLSHLDQDRAPRLAGHANHRRRSGASGGHDPSEKTELAGRRRHRRGAQASRRHEAARRAGSLPHESHQPRGRLAQESARTCGRSTCAIREPRRRASRACRPRCRTVTWRSSIFRCGLPFPRAPTAWSPARVTRPWPSGCGRWAARPWLKMASCARFRWLRPMSPTNLLQNLEGPCTTSASSTCKVTEIGDLGMEYLAGLTGLEELSLSATTISDAGLEHLAGMTRAAQARAEQHARSKGPGLKYLQGRHLARAIEPVELAGPRRGPGGVVGADVAARSVAGVSPISPTTGLAHLKTLDRPATARPGGHRLSRRRARASRRYDRADVSAAQLHADHRRGPAVARGPHEPARTRPAAHAGHRQEHGYGRRGSRISRS